MTDDTRLLDWLEEHCGGAGLLSDDAGRWAVVHSGLQPMVSDEAITGEWSYLCEAEDWKPSVREAIAADMEAAAADKPTASAQPSISPPDEAAIRADEREQIAKGLLARAMRLHAEKLHHLAATCEENARYIREGRLS